MPNQRKQTRPKGGRDDSFAATAKRLGCDEDKATFEAKLKKIAKVTVSEENKRAWGKRGFKAKSRPSKDNKDNKAAWAKLKS